MEKKKLKDFIKDNLSVRDMFNFINTYFIGKNIEEYEAIFDLYDESDFKLFVNLYGIQTAERCQKEKQYWIGGLNYYSNPLDKTGCRCTQIFSLDDEKMRQHIEYACDDIETTIAEYIEVGTNIDDLVRLLPTYNSCVDIKAYCNTTIKPLYRYVLCVNGNEEYKSASYNKNVCVANMFKGYATQIEEHINEEPKVTIFRENEIIVYFGEEAYLFYIEEIR